MRQTTREEEDELHNTAPRPRCRAQHLPPQEPQAHAWGSARPQALAHTRAPGLSGQPVNSTALGRFHFKK